LAHTITTLTIGSHSPPVVSWTDPPSSLSHFLSSIILINKIPPRELKEVSLFGEKFGCGLFIASVRF